MKSEKKLVVLVDDISLNLHVGRRLLGKKYQVITVPSAKKLFLLLETINPDLILLDVEMPEMSGFEAMEILKAKPETWNIPVIFLSGCARKTDKSMGLAMGAIDYITKPYEPYLLLEKVETHLANINE